MGEPRELRGHDRPIRSLAAVLAGDGRVLLASGDAYGFVRLWDPESGEPAGGPATVDADTVVALGAVRLGSGAWALASCGRMRFTRWDPVDVRDTGSPSWQADAHGAWHMAVVPATAAAPAWIVAAAQGGVRVIDPENGRTVFEATGEGLDDDPVTLRLAGGRIGDGTAGFAVVRYGGDLELWAPSGAGEWQRRDIPLPGSLLPNAMAFFTGADGEPRIAVAERQTVTVLDVRTGEQVTQDEFDVRVDVLAPVPLEDRTLLALGFTHRQDVGVRLWDPHTRRLVGEVFHRVGPDIGDRGSGGGPMRSVITVAGPDGSVRVASAAGDDVVRVSAPLDPGSPSGIEGAQEMGAEIRVTGDTSVRATTVSAAIEAFNDAIKAVPVVDRDRLRAEYADLRRSWRVKGLVSGSLDEIAGILRAQLETDAGRGGGTYFLVNLMESERCVQVNTIQGGAFHPYRVWRTADGFSVYSNRSLTDRPRRWRRS
ncbi:hypothetical protein E1293_14705 [Actinomadura darangshiensis]|uniref:WD40 repeat domain-containing protein n=1 Tax=Actinomadura darangshiensis TaxID=705336 RepID=A0A4R5BHV7_9ACTN|nr:hypothetical protein [Actinomadura darangshiensis]TDD83414.1 hypothetical protein E1293_14705 [Actinomadura darangshiensis]